MNRCLLSSLAASRTRSSALRALVRLCVPGARFAPAGSPRPAPFPPSPPLPDHRHCSGISPVLRSCPTSPVRSPSAYILGFPDAASDTPLPKANKGSPGSRTRCFHTCPRSSTAQGPVVSRASDTPDFAFHLSQSVGTLEYVIFHGSNLGLHVPLSTLRRPLAGSRRMTRGRCGSLLLHRTTLSSATPRRF